MDVYEIDPTADERWEELLQNHPRASIFHTRGWLEALKKTYGYTPVAFTTSPPGSPLTNGIPFCRITGWFGRARLVSLPFSDHCTPLVESEQQLTCLLAYFRKKLHRESWSYIQIRANEPAASCSSRFENSNAGYVLHKLDLTHDLSDIFRCFHASCVQRKIRRAEREGLTCEEGRSEPLLNAFYRLLTVTRRRHGVPPQPMRWFREMLDCFGDKLKIRVAYLHATPVASILTLSYKRTLTYKYGGSDDTFSALGGMQLLLWRAIQEGSRNGMLEFDMGRTESDEHGLIAFKDRWGAARTSLAYFQYPPHRKNALATMNTSLGKYVCSHVPSRVLPAVGRLLYRHAG